MSAPPDLPPSTAPLTERQIVELLSTARQRLFAEVGKVIVGQKHVIDEMLIALLSGGHCLITGAPGLAKTLLIKTVADVCHLSFQRVQFTPDLMPSDITGTEILEDSPEGRKLVFSRGPIFANMILADEINRTPPKTQAALLEAMQEHQVTVNGKTMRENVSGAETWDREVIKPFDAPLKEAAGFLVLKGNFFDFAIMKTSVIGPDFRARYLSEPGRENIFEGRAVVFDSAEDYHHRINDADLGIDDRSILIVRNAGPVGWPGAAEVVNMQPPDALLKAGVPGLPVIGDGRQSGTSDSPAILHVSPEAAVGGGIGWIRTGDVIRIDLNTGDCNVLLSDDEIATRKANPSAPPPPASQTPWQELYRAYVGQLDTGGVFEFAVKYRGVSETTPRHNH